MRTLVLVDCQNLYHDCRSWGKKLDFQRLQKLIHYQFGDKDIKVKVYLVADQESDTRAFEYMLRCINFEYKIKRSVRRYKSKATNHDVNIIMDALDCLEAADRLVLISGDGDFADLLRRYKDCNKLTEVWAFKESFSKLLVQVVDSIRFLNNEDIFKEDGEGTAPCDPSETLDAFCETGSIENLSDPTNDTCPDDPPIVSSTSASQ